MVLFYFFCHKVKCAGGWLLLSVSVPVAAYCKLDWPQACDFLFSRIHKKIKKTSV